jgi:hypothetical protein
MLMAEGNAARDIELIVDGTDVNEQLQTCLPGVTPKSVSY